MKWNLQELKTKLQIISAKIKETTDQNEIEFLKQELKMIKAMIDYILEDNSSKENYILGWLVSDDDCRKKAEILTKCLVPLTSRLDFLTYSRRLPFYYFAKKEIDSKTTLKLTEGFLENFEFDLLKTYNELVQTGALNLSMIPYYEPSCLGITCYLPTFNQSYIDAIHNGKIENIGCLPHEIGHAYQFKNTDNVQSQSMTYSVFREAFPHFVELAFLDYLKHTKYFKSAMNIEREFIESMSIIYELYGTTYIQSDLITSVDSKTFTNGSGELIEVGDTSRFISKLLACYFIYLYRSCKNGIDTINRFNEMYRQNQEYEFFKTIPLEKIIESIREEFRNYYDNIHNRKKLEIR